MRKITQRRTWKPTDINCHCWMITLDWVGHTATLRETINWCKIMNEKYTILVKEIKTNSKEQSLSWEVISHPDSQEITAHFMDIKCSVLFHKIPSFVLIQSQTNLANTLTYWLCKIPINAFLPPVSRSSNWTLPFKVENNSEIHVRYLLDLRILIYQVTWSL